MKFVVNRHLLPAAIAISLMAGPAMAQTPAPASAAGNAENGKKLFVTYLCWSCHGSSGRAGGAALSGPNG